MSSKTLPIGPTPSPEPDAQGPEAPGREPIAAETRADGRLDWSILMARAQGGDRDAYRRLLEAITPYLRALAARRIGNRSDLEDTVQDILLTVHTVRHTYDPALPFGPWLLTIAKRRIVDGLRRQERSSAHELPIELEHETLWASHANLQEEAADARVLREAIEHLPAGQRDAIRMLKLEEMSLQEASAASAMSVVSLKVATHRALKKLRAMIEKSGDRT
ncbi:sigma-70 family RNA polymerase sigma factor [Polaromonas jejuensis]|uniref:Sigma-70 family RNA polymerase sigma factor n=1 Tax=Polaromonas jejuensis TaxID=457502 RepID=A0ABW0Q5S5_9BURK|nr:sigma-70 family RNA polymerase sigma factor [Polaromonas jejuensis]